MPLRPLTDLGPADWLSAADAGGFDVISLGAPGFEAYVRLLHALDPDLSGDQATLNVEGELGEAQLIALCEVLARHTTTPDDAYFALWDGYGSLHGGTWVLIAGAEDDGPTAPASESELRAAAEAALRSEGKAGSGQLPPAFPPEVMKGPRLGLSHGRSYLLFEGPLAEAGHWGGHPAHGWINSPNLFWPADRAWCAATEIDLPWTGIGGSQALIDELHADDRFDVVHADPHRDQPYR
ncbi:hypothetical protein [Mumia sp. DW29H23]|uniref:hypothetical protein n=1 Tax=Mumia sp. DW29H23 TaxID=3421241 RepID=UPI003D689EE8